MKRWEIYMDTGEVSTLVIWQIRAHFYNGRVIIYISARKFRYNVVFLTLATRYGLDGSEIESWWERIFSHPSRRALVLAQPPMQWVPGLFPGIKRPQRGVGHPCHLEPRLKEECRYNYLPSGPSWLFWDELSSLSTFEFLRRNSKVEISDTFLLVLQHHSRPIFDTVETLCLQDYC